MSEYRTDRPATTRHRIAWVALALLVTLVAVMFTSPAVGAQERTQDRDCANTSTGKTPITDLGTGTYLDAQGGLYPNGSNDVPAAHLAVGIDRASRITPRAADGTPDPSGKIGFASIGVSNTFRAFDQFEKVFAGRSDVADSIVTVNAAQGGQDLTVWSNPTGRPWEGLDSALTEAGVTAAQVQVLWVMLTDRIDDAGPPPFPDHALAYTDRLATVMQTLQDRLPNLEVAYISSRTYGGYNDVSSPSPEPTAYEEGFGVKWLIERQMNGEAGLNADPSAGDVDVPWIAWGPYMWADGTTARQDGLLWDCRDYRGDGVHPEGSGNDKIAALIMGFLDTDPTAAWAFTGGVLPAAPTGGEPAAPPTTIDGAGDVTTTTVAPTDEERVRPRDREQRDRTREDVTTTVAPSADGSADGTDTSSAPDTTLTQDGEPSQDVAQGTTEDGSTTGDGPSPIVWVLLGAGGALIVVALAAWANSRRNRPDGPTDV